MTENIVWAAHARRWAHVGPPLRPSTEDLAAYGAAVADWLETADRLDPTLVVMGVTPELCNLPVPVEGRVIAVDQSRPMIGSVWPGPLRAHDAAVCADWRAMPLAASSVDVVLADGTLTTLPYPSGYAATCREISRVLRRGGRWVLRSFAQREIPETVDQVVADLDAGGIGSFHVLKWRLAMALHDDPSTGVPVEAVWDVVEAALGGVDALAERLGWPIEEVRTIESYRDARARYTFPTLSQLKEIVGAAGFTVAAVTTPGYELGDRCPILVLEPRS